MCLGLLMIWTAQVSCGTDCVWSGSGSWGTGPNWSPGGPPGPADNALFFTNSTADCTLDANRSVSAMEFVGNPTALSYTLISQSQTLDLGGHALILRITAPSLSATRHVAFSNSRRFGSDTAFSYNTLSHIE